MPTDSKQELLDTDEVVSLLQTETPTTHRKGYEEYRKEAEAKAEVDKEPVEDNTDEEDIPEKFKGKSLKDVVESYTALESEFGKRGTELGTLRSHVDKLLELGNTPKDEPAPKKKVEVDSLLESPDDVINSVVEDNPRLKALEKRLADEDLAKAQAQFESQHNDWKEVINSPEFGEWVMASPVRQRMFVDADKNYDYETGSELLTLFKDTKGKAVAEAKEDRDTRATKAAKDGVTETGGDTGERKLKKYRRSEIVELRLTNPQEFERQKPAIMAAYREGRVI